MFVVCVLYFGDNILYLHKNTTEHGDARRILNTTRSFSETRAYNTQNNEVQLKNEQHRFGKLVQVPVKVVPFCEPHQKLVLCVFHSFP